jgi:hypothetical protein
MNTDNTFTTPYPGVNLVLQLLLENVKTVLGDYFVGMYLYGSLAGGEFRPERSDIDFVVVTSEELPDNLILGLKNMHVRIHESGLEWAKRLEGSYIPLDAMPAYNPTGLACPMINEGKFEVARHGIDWVINRHILYTSGVVITGPPLRTMINPVRPDELREAALSLLRDTWTPWLYNPDFFLEMGYQPYVVLTMCRALYTLKHGIVASKRISAEWVIAQSEGKWTKLIDQAIACRYGNPPGDIKETQRFMRYVFKEAGL